MPLCVKIFIAAFFGVLCSASASALPLTWRADWPDAKPVETLVHRGTDIELQPTWYINKAPADTTGWTYTTFCQTNAVGPWFGPLPGAFFSHTNDVGAAFYNVMVRAQTPGGQVNYTAFARLRMLDSPGFTPGELPLPVSAIDFSKVVAINAPWLLPAATNGLLSSACAYTDAATNTLNRAVNDNLANNYYTIAETDDAIDSLAAYYITYTAAGAAFPTRAALLDATVVYSGGAARTPTRNDYAVVLADESHGGAEWRYIYTVAAGATSGQWDAQYPIETNDYDGLSNKPRINGVSLSGNKTGEALGVLDLSGGTLTGSLYFSGEDRCQWDFINLSNGGEFPGGMTIGYDTYSRWFLFRSLDASYNWTTVRLPADKDGTVAFTSDIPNISGKADKADVAAAALAATNYTDSAIGAAIANTNPTFSNAVLSVGLGIDTNTVAAINALVEAGDELPIGGATSVGALLLALAAAVAALKKRLPYALVVKEIENGAVALDDRASNTVEISATLSPNTLTVNFPATSGKARDFALRLNIASGVTAPELVLPQGVVCENADGGVPGISDGGTGGSSTILYFSETENNGTTAKFLLKGETLAAITQA